MLIGLLLNREVLNLRLQTRLTNHNVRIPHGYWATHSTGRMTLEYEVPWTTPESVFRLNELITKDIDVLEFGSGGSTLFFANRARSVVSFDNQLGWIEKVVEKTEGMSNVQITHIKDKEQFMETFPRKRFDCVLIDPKRKFLSRDLILNKCIDILKSPSIIVLDNYANISMFPQTHRLHGKDLFDHLGLVDFVEELYNHKKWDGRGTRILREAK